jgi:hypothetical protein
MWMDEAGVLVFFMETRGGARTLVFFDGIVLKAALKVGSKTALRTTFKSYFEGIAFYSTWLLKELVGLA